MAGTTNLSRIEVAKEFVRIGFGEVCNSNAVFYSLSFLTQELSTTEVQAVLPVVENYNAFDGKKVAAEIERFRGKVSGWQFGCQSSPILVVKLPYSTNQLEEALPSRFQTGERIPEVVTATIVAQMRELFIKQLGADEFAPRDDSDHNFAAWWG